ncbi:glycoside hydrolase family 28 protein [Guyanagaster necrorhizus]|uniref:endo-polygalacturonase n=1 Tax=Guyanagaster necrorhizus TaxID=856835 RepID=A0A9P7VVW3_9AGAR|nr:glycoside hydrolase family 28 protein [Guyanagaster necrorhizus MCA 3950]KAG7447909.1 glycoside hydrolase family 28 protein [Guyanagaster necrorhizus MCA 3950]
MFKYALFQALVSAAVLVSAVPIAKPGAKRAPRPAKRASCTVDSVDAASSISDCSSVTISAFTVASGDTLVLSPADGATVTMAGDITFAQTSTDGPLFTIDGSDITFNGAGYKFDGNGADYWDGEGTNGGVDKPHPLLKFKGSGTYSDFTVLNTPAQAISIGNSDGLTFDSITVDNSAGDTDDLGHNTDGFDVSADDVTIQNSVVKNQDDCIAINDGSNIQFLNNQCSGGHGISIGSIASDDSVSGITISGNTVTDSMYGFRIKVQASATSASVSNITYSGNTVSGIDEYGVLITQSYPDDDGTPGTGGPISDVSFTGDATTITVGDDAERLTVDCGACSGTWDFSALTITGGSEGTVDSDSATISGGSY